MHNIIKSDLYRLFRSKGFYITGILVILYMLGMSIMEISFGDANHPITGIQAAVKGMDFTFFLWFFILAFIVFICSADFSSGAVKNTLSCGKSRGQLFFAKLIMVVVTCFIVLLLNVVIGTMVATLINGFGGSFDLAYIGSVARPFFAQLLFTVGVAASAVFLAFVAKRTAAVIGGFIGFVMITNIFLQVLTVNEKTAFLYDYDLQVNLHALANIDSVTTTVAARGLVEGALLLIAFVVCGFILFRKSEIK